MSRQSKKPNRLEHWQRVGFLLGLFDVVVVNASYLLALWLRFDCKASEIGSLYLQVCKYFLPIYTVVCIVVFSWQRLYKSIWRFASFHEFIRVSTASLITTVIHVLGTVVVCGIVSDNDIHRMPITYYVVGAGLQFVLMIGIRFSYRFVLLERKRRLGDTSARVMLVGAGGAGQMILKSIREQPDCNLRVCCIIDDNPNKLGRDIMGVPVVGSREDILSAAQKYRIEKIFVAIPSAQENDRRDILNICKETGCELKNLPGINQIVTSSNLSFSDMKDVAVEDLLGREPIRVDMAGIYRYIRGKTILVTGGGGSIGSELCRQIAGHDPKKLIIFEVYENNAYDIQQELLSRYPELDLCVRIGSVRDSRCLESVFSEYRPDIVYHAAAHKHVPLMEASPCGIN